jgi:transcription initiation factor IIF auxiliary subunit
LLRLSEIQKTWTSISSSLRRQEPHDLVQEQERAKGAEDRAKNDKDHAKRKVDSECQIHQLLDDPEKGWKEKFDCSDEVHVVIDTVYLNESALHKSKITWKRWQIYLSKKALWWTQ